VRGCCKAFPGARALHEVNLIVHPGEVVAVVGENGAGKSTLMKILAGVESADRGEILVAGRSVRIGSVRAALRLGIALIHQELNLCDNLTVGANVFLGREPRRFGLIDSDGVVRGAESWLAELGLAGRSKDVVRSLSIGQQQLVEIAKALAVDARILIMDEPTSSLCQHEAERLFQVVDRLRRRGVSILYISHRLTEIEALADRVVVLRDGENVGELSGEEIQHDAIVRLMVGRNLDQFYRRSPHVPGREVLAVEGLRTTRYPAHAIDLTLRAGEIVGIAGLVGAGRSELLRGLFGADPALAGTVRVDGRVVRLTSPSAAIASGLALVPEDRKQQGILLDLSVQDNLSLVRLRSGSRTGFVDAKAEAASARKVIEELRIKTPGVDRPTRFLSGGNQQKVVLGKWLGMSPRVLMLDEPTRGIDVGAKQEIYNWMDELARRGVAILFASSELPEVIGMADRVLVMREGAIVGKLERADVNEEAVMRMAVGRDRDTAP
jgi:ribose transport system ATP-binding protein